jgi:ribosomal protein S18 acetylase RimI-like enzyme
MRIESMLPRRGSLVTSLLQPVVPAFEVLDLRHYAAESIRPILEAESRQWAERLSWDYRASITLLLQYLDARLLPGFVAVEHGRVIGYTFCVYEDRKAVIGDLFALAEHPGYTQTEIEAVLLEHLITLLKNSPGVDRIESQLLLHTHELHAELFRAHGFGVYERIFMDLALETLGAEDAGAREQVLAKHNLVLRAWQDSDAHAYEGHLDSPLTDQYRSVAGSLRFLHNIIRFPGCGIFDAGASQVLVHQASGALAGLVLCSKVRGDVEHVTQLCVAARARGAGLGTLLLKAAAGLLKTRGFARLSLTVTGSNVRAAALYRQMGFAPRHSFDAMVWTSQPTPADEPGVLHFPVQSGA